MRLAFCILLILSVHFALAPPVAVGDMLEALSNVVDVPKDGLAAWEKRIDSDDEDYEGSTNEGYRYDNPRPGSDAPGGNNEDDMLGSESPWDSEQMESDARGPDRYYNNPPEDSDEEDSGAKPAKDDGAKPDDEDDGAKSDDDDNDDDNGSGYDGDDDDDDTYDNDHSGYGSTTHTSLGLESEHPATPEHMTDLEKLFRLRPRNSGYAKEGVAGDTKAYFSDSSQTTQVTNILALSSMVRARATSVRSVIGAGAFKSVHNLPVHRQYRKKWILDRPD